MDQIASKLLTAQKSGRKSRSPPNAIKLQNRHSRGKEEKKLQNVERRHFLYTQIFSYWYMRKTSAQCDLEKHYFYKGSTLSDWDRAQQTRAQFRGLAFYKQSSCPMRWAICDSWPLLLLPHVSSEMPIFLVRNSVGPELALRWTPNRPFFSKNTVPQTTVRPIYIYTYLYTHIHMCVYTHAEKHKLLI